MASIYIEVAALKRLADVMYNHIINLNLQFHEQKSSGETLKAVKQGNSLNDIIKGTYNLFFAAIRLVSAVCYLRYFSN